MNFDLYAQNKKFIYKRWRIHAGEDFWEQLAPYLPPLISQVSVIRQNNWA